MTINGINYTGEVISAAGMSMELELENPSGLAVGDPVVIEADGMIYTNRVVTGIEYETVYIDSAEVYMQDSNAEALSDLLDMICDIELQM